MQLSPQSVFFFFPHTGKKSCHKVFSAALDCNFQHLSHAKFTVAGKLLKCLLHLHAQIENQGREKKVNKKHFFIVLVQKEYEAMENKLKIHVIVYQNMFEHIRLIFIYPFTFVYFGDMMDRKTKESDCKFNSFLPCHQPPTQTKQKHSS